MCNSICYSAFHAWRATVANLKKNLEMERLLEGFLGVNSDFFSPKFRDSRPVGDALKPTHQIPTGARPTTNARFFATKTHKHIMLKAVVIIIIVLCPSFIFLN